MGDIEQGVPVSETPTAEPIDTTEENATTDASVASPSSDNNRRDSCFVDYVPPPPRPIPPPAKYKLWFMVIFCVYFAEWFATEAGFLRWLQNTFSLSLNGALFFLLACIVCTLIYSAFDLLIFCVRIKIRGQWYGLGSWLKQPRIQWIYQYQNCVVEFIRSIVVIFEDGFALFNAPPPPKPDKPKAFESEEGKEVVLKIENRIHPDKLDDYIAWRDKIIQLGCHSRPGLLNVKEETIQDPKGDVHVTYLTFDSIDHLNDYMTSPVRDRIVRNLQPMLLAPTLVQLRKDRELPDAFTDLCTKQGQPVPVRLPKKWRVWFITTMGLWFVVIITNATVFSHYFEAWGMNDTHSRVQSLVRVLFNTFLNTYVMTPFLILIFGNWMKRTDLEGDNHEPWRTLNDGIKTIWGKLILFLAFYGTCAVAWAIPGGS